MLLFANNICSFKRNKICKTPVLSSNRTRGLAYKGEDSSKFFLTCQRFLFLHKEHTHKNNEVWVSFESSKFLKCRNCVVFFFYQPKLVHILVQVQFFILSWRKDYVHVRACVYHISYHIIICVYVCVCIH